MMKRFGVTPAEEQALSNKRVRDIVHEIVEFGISQDEILNIISHLALELESQSQLQAITQLITSFRPNKLVQLEETNNNEEV